MENKTVEEEKKNSLNIKQPLQKSEELAEDFMLRYDVPNPEHSPRAVKYLVEMYKYYELG